ncbi:MAG: Fructose-bisphosphate aldolase class II, partial [uncultured Blastococcus sp.]
AHRDPRGLRRHDPPGQGERIRLPVDQLHLLGDGQRGPPRLRRRRQRRDHPVL